MARVDGADLRGRKRSPGERGHRRRGGGARPAAHVLEPPPRAQGAHRPLAPRRFPFGGRTRQHARGLPRPPADQSRARYLRATNGAGMDLVELKEKETIKREDAAARLRAIADELASGNDIVLERDHLRFVARVPDEVQLKIEFEVEDDGTEFEIELTW